MLILLAIFIVLLFLVGIAVRNHTEPEKPAYRYARKQALLTPSETQCYKALVGVVGADYFIFAQVHLSSLLDEKQFKGQNWKGARARIDRKSVDFVLCDKEQMSPKLAIELDDWSHSRSDRISRDQMVEEIFKETGIPLLRVRSSTELVERLPAMLLEVQN